MPLLINEETGGVSTSFEIDEQRDRVENTLIVG